MEAFTLKTPETIKKELDTASDDMADKQYTYKRLDEHKKILSETLTVKYRIDKSCSMAEAKSYALSEQSYKNHIDGLVEAEKQYTKAKSNYANLLASLEYMRSWIATQRHISK
jgi:tRNA nucleotidyltransferase/poly(A) polymerase